MTYVVGLCTDLRRLGVPETASAYRGWRGLVPEVVWSAWSGHIRKLLAVRPAQHALASQTLPLLVVLRYELSPLFPPCFCVNLPFSSSFFSLLSIHLEASTLQTSHCQNKLCSTLRLNRFFLSRSTSVCACLGSAARHQEAVGPVPQVITPMLLRPRYAISGSDLAYPCTPSTLCAVLTWHISTDPPRRMSSTGVSYR